MIYALSIDWLSLFCKSPTGELDLTVETYTYNKHDRGTRSYAELYDVVYCGELLCQVQQHPYSGILETKSMIIKVDNRRLYEAGVFSRIERFLMLQNIVVQNISRVDLCADFNKFAGDLHPITLISDFLASRLRHVGRGNGDAHFNHYAEVENGISKSVLQYTGLSFGSHESDARVYLYDKTYELLTVKDKPYIKDLWKRAGLINNSSCHVWRLEVSLKSKSMQFKNKATKQVESISVERLGDNSEVLLLYHTFVRSLFKFVKNREGIRNITREPIIELFNGEPYINRGVLPALSGGNRCERMLIKSLWQISQKYRGPAILQDEGICKSIALDLAESTGLVDWLQRKCETWNVPHKL